MNIIRVIFLSAIYCWLLSSCKKQDWLDEKNKRSSVVPETVADFQALLDDFTSFNSIISNAGTASADDFYVTSSGFTNSAETERNLLTWSKSIWATNESAEWNNHFRAIGITNNVIEGLSQIKGNDKAINAIKGHSLFLRAFSYFTLAQIFCKPYTPETKAALGLPIRLSGDVNEIVQRSSLEATYTQIISDALAASALLPENQPYFSRPINAAAFALLARVYLTMDDFANAEKYTKESLKIRSELLDFNNSEVVSASSTYRFLPYGKSNPEILFYAEGGSHFTVVPATSATGLVSPELFAMYEPDDLRRTIFYQSTGSEVRYRGSYSGGLYNFGGLSVNELYLINAECAARRGDVGEAMSALNSLLVKRYAAGKFTARNSSTPDETLVMVLQERRKELAFVGNIRWGDLRRLNRDNRFKTEISRTINSQTYNLPPNDVRYVLPIPMNEINLSNIQQNER